MKKFITIGTLVSVLLVGCSNDPVVNYDRRTYKMSELEERLEDKIENENPKYDVEVDIVKESKSKKKHKKPLKSLKKAKNVVFEGFPAFWTN
ncbi:hypothetical protein P9D57_17680 [Bacillus sonorensis]|uniref:hypothetical protein n=1 Tax=Bacillus sonorensis TaxID=119858 RepID=UPI002DB6FF59|nr:hypothetical protein [Bacillus sonorensis]MEC1440522.1 hypothetical protein [Bacillus sonorensis]